MSWEAWVAPLPYLLALLLVPRVIHERRPSGATVAWLLAIGLFPALGVPLYLLLGGRTIRRRIRARTGREEIAPPSPPPLEAELGPVASRCSETLVRVGAPPPVPGPGVRFFEDGVSAYAGLMEAFDRARHHIHVQTFILGRDPTGRAVVRRLAERAAEGVRVRLLVDGFGAFPFFYRFTAPLARAGGEARIFHPTFPVWRAVTANLRNHRKIVVVDGELAVVGGMNLKDEYMAPEPLPDQWIDYNMSLEGPGVGHLQALFLEDWRDAGGRPPEPGEPLFPRPSPHVDGAESPLQVVPSGPDLPRRPIHYGVLAALTAAQRRVVI
ncbi:MAG: cardiolipin synthase, partial [Nitrospirae bacterium]